MLAALLLPVGLLAVIKYWQAGNVNIKFAAFIAIGFLIGGWRLPENLIHFPNKDTAAYITY